MFVCDNIFYHIDMLAPQTLPVLSCAMCRSPPTPTRRTSSSRPGGFTLGREHFARISAVEGIALTPEMRATFDGFDRDGLSAEERRRAITSRFAPSR